MKVVECEQYSDEWWAARVGIPTASNFDSILTPAKMAPSTKAEAYQCRLLAEWMTGKPVDTYQNDAMTRGLELEPAARESYQFITDAEVAEVGLCLEDTGRWGCSPDGLVGDDGLLEIKCPTPGVHVGYLLSDQIPLNYKLQCLGQLLITGRDWLDFMSYHPDMDPLIVRMYAREVKDELSLLHNALEAFHGVLETRKQYLIEKGYGPLSEAA